YLWLVGLLAGVGLAISGVSASGFGSCGVQTITPPAFAVLGTTNFRCIEPLIVTTKEDITISKSSSDGGITISAAIVSLSNIAVDALARSTQYLYTSCASIQSLDGQANDIENILA